jgi:hypothetical protein
LFDGKSTTGWCVKPGGEWTVKEGTIVGTSPATERRHGLLVTRNRFSDFTVRLQYKAIQGNSGLYFRADTVSQPVAANGFQAEIDAEKDAGGLYETEGRAWVVQPDPASVKEWFRPQAWNTMVVRARGRNITVWVNGITSAELKNDPGRLAGHLALQLHGSMDMVVEFKDIFIRIP